MNPPDITFCCEKKKDNQEDIETKKLKICTEPDNEDSDKLEIRATAFDEGNAEDWVKWSIQMDELVRDMNMSTAQKKIVWPRHS